MRRQFVFLLLALAIVAILSGCVSLGNETSRRGLPATHPQTDFDGDGLVDWEDSDDDNDGYSDEAEQAAGSDPRDSTSTPQDDS
jgi:hypothetical protein